MATDIIIRKQKIKVKTGSESEALQIRRHLNDRLQYDLIKIFESAFPNTLNQDEYLTIDNIKIDLGLISAGVFEQHFVSLVNAKLKAELQKKFAHYTESPVPERNSKTLSKAPREGELQSRQVYETNALLYFLEYGIYPWWYKKEQQQTPGELLKKLTDTALDSLLLHILSGRSNSLTKVSEIIIERFFIHLVETQYEQVIQRMISLVNNSALRNNIDSLLSQQEDHLKSLSVTKQKFYKTLFLLLTDRNDDGSANTIHTFITQLQQNQSVTTDNTNQSTTNENKSLPEKGSGTHPMEEGIYINNAGLILLHPFLAAFFSHFHLLDEQQQFISVTKQYKAAVLLFYMQGFNEAYEEWNMAFNKIICGLAVEDVLHAGIDITEEEKEECRTLLQAVADYWEALKGVSAEALQNTFFLREGKIRRKEDHWLLQVERTGVDILLDKLPWSFSTVKLPWLQLMIYTEW